MRPIATRPRRASADDNQPAEPSVSSTRTGTFLQGAVAFAVMFGLLWWLLSRNDR